MDEELLVLTLREQRDLADRRAEYFAAMAYTIAKQAKLSEDEISEIRAKVRPQHGASDESQGPLADAGPGARRHQTYVERLGSFLARVGHPSDIAAPRLC